MLNNARIQTFGGFVPLFDIEEVDAERNIWKGKTLPSANVIPPPGMKLMDKESQGLVYFSRNYKPDVNDLDQIYVETEIVDTDIIGIPFWLIPQQKLMFGYEPPSTILKPGAGTIVAMPNSTRKRMGGKK